MRIYGRIGMQMFTHDLFITPNLSLPYLNFQTSCMVKISVSCNNYNWRRIVLTKIPTYDLLQISLVWW